jgi:hypothetical protein
VTILTRPEIGGEQPSYGPQLDDNEVAAVLTYIRKLLDGAAKRIASLESAARYRTSTGLLGRAGLRRALVNLPTGLSGHATLARDQRRLADTLLNVDFRLLLTPLTEAMIASAIQAAINPYSMAVAPDSSRKKRCNKLISFSCLRREHIMVVLINHERIEGNPAYLWRSFLRIAARPQSERTVGVVFRGDYRMFSGG